MFNALRSSASRLFNGPLLRLLAPALPLVAGLCLAATPAQGADEPEAQPAGTDTHGSVGAIRALGAARPSLSDPLRLEGVVTFVHATQRRFYLHDGTGQVAVVVPPEGVPLPRPGETVELTALRQMGARVPELLATALTRGSPAELPPAPEISFAEARAGAFEHQWVSLRGRLTRIDSFADWQRLTLAVPEGEFTVSILATQPPDFREGARLSVRGVCRLWSPPGSMEIGGFYLFAPSLDEVRPESEARDTAPVLASIAQVRRLTATELEAGLPVRLRGVVTFAHPDQRIIYLNDDAGGVRVWFAREDTPLPAAGTEVSVEGVTSAGASLPGVCAHRVESLGPHPLPTPRPISLEQARTGAQDGQWVEMRGQLRQVDALGDWLRLFLTTAAGEITASIPQSAAPELAVGSFLKVRGVCQSWTNQYDRIAGFFLYVPSAAELVATEPPPADPFAVPEESIRNLALYRPETLEMQRIRLRGTVLLHRPGHFVVVENTTGVVRAYGAAADPLRPGDLVEVAGVPGRQGARSVLRGAVLRRLAAGVAPVPLALPRAPAVDPALDGRLVSLVGRLTAVSVRPRDTRLSLALGASSIELAHPGPLPAAVAEELEVGSVVAAVGLYAIEYDEAEEPASFSIQLRSPADLTLKERPPWWTARRALSALGAIALCLVLGLGWVALLRRQLRRQTAVIRRQMENEVVLSARQREIVENASDFIFSTDLAGRITSFNPAGERMTGYRAAEALALGFGDLLGPGERTTLAAFLAHAQPPAPDAPTPVACLETRLRTRDRHTVCVEISARPIRAGGRIVGLLGIARDITARRRMEILDRQLQKAESLGRMAAAIAHHFNNQIQTVLMGLEMLRLELRHDATTNEVLDTAERSARQASEIGALLLTYLGQSGGERQRLDLARCGRDALATLLERRLQNLVVESVLPEPGPTIKADPAQVQQLLRCLLANAEESLAPAGGTIRVEVSLIPAAALPTQHRLPVDFEPLAASYACVSILDTGCGITEENLGRIFDPFFTTKFHGRGRGLALVLGIARAHDAAVAVSSRPGEGSVFQVFFPSPPAAED